MKEKKEEEQLSWEEKYWITRKSYNNILLENANLSEENTKLKQDKQELINFLKKQEVYTWRFRFGGINGWSNTRTRKNKDWKIF